MQRWLRAALAPRDYDLFRLDPPLFDPHETAHSTLHWSRVSSATIAEIELARPGYGPSAERYLSHGHLGIVGRTDDHVVTLSWMFINATDHDVKVKRYFPLAPGAAYLHADWTHPSWRGKGLHLESIIRRKELAIETASSLRLYANIEPDNEASVRNYTKAGFHRAGKLRVWPLGPFNRSRLLENEGSA